MTIPAGFQSLEDMLGAQSAQLKSLTARAKVLLDLQSALRALLPAPLRDQCSVGQWADSRLTVYASNGTIAARVKQQVPTYCKKLSERGFDVREIAVKVLAHEKEMPPHALKADIPQHALARFSALGETLGAGPLKTAIETLVKHRRSR